MAGTGLLAELFESPRVLAGGAAGFACATLCVWTFRGLPLGSVVFWLAPLPIFLAGLSVGPLTAWLALVVAAGALLPTEGLRGTFVFLLATGLPSALLTSMAVRPGGLVLRVPFATLGVWPAIVAALSLLLAPAGMGEVMMTQVSAALSRSGVEAGPGTVEALIRASTALAAAALALPLLLCGVGAQRFLSRRGLASCSTPRWSEARLPNWYPVLPLAALAAAAAAPPSLAISASAAGLFMPLFLQGLAVLHVRLRVSLLVLFYVLLVVFFIPVAMAAIALGLSEHFGRKPSKT